MLYKSCFYFLLVLALVGFRNDTYAQRIRVLTYNIHHGEDINGKLDLRQIAAVILKAKPDVVALQEVDSSTNRTGKVDQLKKLSMLTNMQYFYGKNMDYDGGGYGVGILTKLPITDSFVIRLPNFPKSEPRVVATVELQAKNKKRFLFSSIHLDYVRNPEERMQQAKTILEVFSEETRPSILAGDFNAQPGEATMQDLIFRLYDDTDRAGNSFSFPSQHPKTKIDYILVSKRHRWKNLRYKVLEEKVASDHRPVLSVVQLQ